MISAATTRLRVTAYAGIAAGIISSVLLLVTSAPPARLVGALVLALVPAGAGVMCWIDAGDATAQAGLILTVSLALFALLSAVLIWAAQWQPPALIALAGLSLASCGARLLVTRRQPASIVQVMGER